jgi:hypothetical protein
MADNYSTSSQRRNDPENEKKLAEILKRYETLDDENNLINNILESFYNQINDTTQSNLVTKINEYMKSK